MKGEEITGYGVGENEWKTVNNNTPDHGWMQLMTISICNQGSLGGHLFRKMEQYHKSGTLPFNEKP